MTSNLLHWIRLAIAEHLVMPPSDVTDSATLGRELALDSLAVFTVIEGAAKLSGRPVAFNYRDPQAIDRLSCLDSLTVAEFAECLTSE